MRAKHVAGSVGSGVGSGVDTEDGGVRKPVTGGARTGEAKEEGWTGPKEGERPTSPSGAG